MKKVIVLFVTNLFFVMLQSSYLLEFFETKHTPNFIVSLVVAYTLLLNYKTAYTQAFIGGLLYDLVLGSTPGIFSLILTSVVYTAEKLRIHNASAIYIMFIGAMFVHSLVLYRSFSTSLIGAGAIVWTLLFSILFKRLINEKHSI